MAGLAIDLPAVLGGQVDGMEPLTHNTGNAATGGIWRVRGPAGTAILKLARPPVDATAPPVGRPGWPTSDEPTHWNYWRRETLAYRTGLPGRVYADAGITAPVLISSVERPDRMVALWLAESTGVPGPAWPVSRLAAFAEQLGTAQARFVDRVPGEPWLSRRWLAQYLADRAPWISEPIPWDHPAGRVWPDRVRDGVRRLWENRAALIAAAEAGPRTLCHLDVWPMNLIAAGAQTTLLDWAFVGEGGLGEDIGNLIPDSVADGLIDAVLLPEIAREVTGGYLAGLRAGGWTGPAETVRRAIAACGAAKYCWLAPMMLSRAAVDSQAASPSYDPHSTTEEVFLRRTGLLALLSTWAATALA
jgi:hypothetical protein